VLAVVNPATEFCEFIDAMWGALPKEVKWRLKLDLWRADPHHRLKCSDKAWNLWDHIDEVDLDKAIRNLTAQRQMDEIFGRLSKGRGAAARAAGRAPALPGFGVRGIIGINKGDI
jgi:hypothetical protein